MLPGRICRRPRGPPARDPKAAQNALPRSTRQHQRRQNRHLACITRACVIEPIRSVHSLRAARRCSEPTAARNVGSGTAMVTSRFSMVFSARDSSYLRCQVCQLDILHSIDLQGPIQTSRRQAPCQAPPGRQEPLTQSKSQQKHSSLRRIRSASSRTIA